MYITIHTGNILQLSDLKRKPGHTPADELYDSLKIIVPKCQPVETTDGNIKIQAVDDTSSVLDPSERDSQKITIKLFLHKPASSASASVALLAALQELGAHQADLLLLSWPEGTDQATGHAIWQEMQRVVDWGKAHTLGVSDMETEQFVELHNWARVKPEAIQINLESCCVVPAELATFTRENNILLLTHNDPRNILPDEAFQDIVSLTTLKTEKANIQWIARYQTMLRCRGIIQNKGYVIQAQTSTGNPSS